MKLLGLNFSPVPSGENTVVTGISPMSIERILTPMAFLPHFMAAPANITDISAMYERLENVVSKLLAARTTPAGFQ